MQEQAGVCAASAGERRARPETRTRTVNRTVRLLVMLIVVLAAPGPPRLDPGRDATAMEAQSEETKSAARQAAASSNPLNGQPEAIEAGRKLYFTWCTQCHGKEADGVSRFGKYAADLRVFWRGYREFVTIVKNGRTDKQMPPWKEVLNDTQISQVGAYLETLAQEGANWK